MSQPHNHNQPKRMLPTPQGGYWFTIAMVIAGLVLFAFIYSYVDSTTLKKTPEIAISQLAHDISAGNVKSIAIDENDLDITYADQTNKISKKESDAALTDTLANYGVSKDALDKVEISVTRESQFALLLSEVAPFSSRCFSF